MKIQIRNNSDVPTQFNQIAEELFNYWILKINSSRFKIIEIEFYYYSRKLNHLDGFTHPHERKEEEFRFHFGGIDITFNSNKDNYGGILIRSIKDKQTNEIINGPRRVVSRIFEEIGNIKNGGTIKLKEFKNQKGKVNIIKTIRVGLKRPNRKTPNDDNYRDSTYRYITELTKENKISNKEKVASQIIDVKKQVEFLGYKLNSK